MENLAITSLFGDCQKPSQEYNVSACLTMLECPLGKASSYKRMEFHQTRLIEISIIKIYLLRWKYYQTLPPKVYVSLFTRINVGDGAFPAYDGRNSLYIVMSQPLPPRQTRRALGTLRKGREFKVAIKYASKTRLKRLSQ